MPNTVLNASNAPTRVVVGVILSPDGQSVLLAQRANKGACANQWEFPGGKIRAEESHQQALARELEEELGICPTAIRFASQKLHRYTDELTVALHFYWVDAFTGTPEGREGQPLQWVSLAELAALDWPAANAQMIQALQLGAHLEGQAKGGLPEYYWITPHLDTADALIEAVSAQLKAGVRWVQFRRKGEMVEDWADTIEQLQHLVHSYGGQLLVNTHPLAGEKLHCDGIHLASGYLMSLTRKPPGFDWVAASVHTPEEIAKANALGVDFVVISPVLPTASHPGEPNLGWETFADLAAQAQMPVYALGGMQPALLPRAQQKGALGIAGIRFQWPES